MCKQQIKHMNEFAVIYFYVSKWSTSMSTDDDVDDRADSCFDFVDAFFLKINEQ